MELVIDALPPPLLAQEELRVQQRRLGRAVPGLQRERVLVQVVLAGVEVGRQLKQDVVGQDLGTDPVAAEEAWKMQYSVGVQ